MSAKKIHLVQRVACMHAVAGMLSPDPQLSTSST